MTSDGAVIATASRPESIARARDMGAHHVVDHHRLIAEVRRVASGGVDDVFTPFSTGNVDALAEVLKAHGAVVAIDDP
jgi:NADPH:quinone reductase-like Zn-dependent oxidoreductase